MVIRLKIDTRSVKNHSIRGNIDQLLTDIYWPDLLKPIVREELRRRAEIPVTQEDYDRQDEVNEAVDDVDIDKMPQGF
tara:strand:+ start:445 stop:678 length:234 start_codon:yes stop_codon:yes gene_type:complete